MINLVPKEGGFSLVQSDRERRISYHEFLSLLNFLKNNSGYEFYTELWIGPKGVQAGYVFYLDEHTLRNLIDGYNSEAAA